MLVAKNIDVNSRTQYLKSLSNFILQSKSTVTKLLDTLGWKEESTVRKNDSLVSCPYDESHRMPPKKLNAHIKKCLWKQQGYHSDDEAFPEPPEEAVPGTVVLDEQAQKIIIRDAAVKDPTIKVGDNIDNRPVPQTTNRLFSDYTTDERRVLYDYVVTKTKGIQPELKEFSLPIRNEEQKGPKTFLELLAAERDSKRRRVRYKAKVHTKNKTYVEIMREVIKNQMEAYEDWLEQECGIVKDNKETVDTKQEKNEEETEKKEEKIWLEWNFQGNPHTRWKVILERELRYQQRLKERTASKEDKDVVDEDGSRRKEYDKYRNKRNDTFSEERKYKKYDDKRYCYDRNSSRYRQGEDEKQRHRYGDGSQHHSRYWDYEYDRRDKEYRRYHEDNKYKKRHRSPSRESSVRTETDSSKTESKKYEEEKTKHHKHKKHKKKHSSKRKHRSSSSSERSRRND